MKLNKFTYLYSKPLGNHTLKIMKNNTWKFTTKPRKSWKYHGILSVWKGGNPGKCFKERNGEYRTVLKWQCYKFVGLSHRTWLRSTSCVYHHIQGLNPALSYNPRPPPTRMLVLTKTPRDSIPRLLHTRKRTKKRTRRTQSSHVFDKFFGFFVQNKYFCSWLIDILLLKRCGNCTKFSFTFVIN